MSLVETVQGYINKIVSAVTGMKSLLLDQETMSIVAMAYSQSEIIAKEVFLLERLDKVAQDEDKKQQQLHHLKAVIFIRPTEENKKHLKTLLSKPRYKEFHIFYSNIVPEFDLQDLGRDDKFELVRQVQEFYADYWAVSKNLFTLNMFHSRGMYLPPTQWQAREKEIFNRNLSGLASACLSLKIKPAIRYSRSSDLSKMLADELNRVMRDEGDLFMFGGHGNSAPQLIILDRRDDPVTPLLTQWTYQAMVHELIPGGIKNNRVDMRSSPNIDKDLQEIVLSPHDDHFFRGSMHLTFGDLGGSIKDLVQEYQRKVKDNRKLESIEDMQNFVDKYPEFKRMSGNVSKHVALVSELARLSDQRQLMVVSELEQELAVESAHSVALEKLLKVMDDSKIGFTDKLRLICLYALRYEDQKHQLPQFIKLLRDIAPSENDRRKVEMIEGILQHAGHKVRGGDLYHSKSLMARASKIFNVKGVESIYTQHQPQITETLDQLLKGKLKPTEYPFVDGSSGPNVKTKSKILMIYVIGGVTYEEECAVQALNNSDQSVRMVLGGSCIHNTKSFIDDVLDIHEDKAVSKDEFKSSAP